MRRVISQLIVVCAVLGTPLSAVSGDVYVAKEGDDANPGTRERPLASIPKAVEAMRGSGPGTIWVGPGEYYLEKGLAFDSQHAGTAEQPLVLRGTEPGQVRLTGARVVDNFRPLTADEAQGLISPEAKQQVLVADLTPQGFPPLGPLPEKHRDHGQEEVVCGDRPMQSARWPNEGFVEFDKVLDSGASGVTHWVSRTVYRPGSFQFPGERAKSWDFRRGVWLHGFWCYEWSDEVLKAASYDPASGELRLAAKHAYGVGSPWRKDSKHPFYALHVFEELDQPGEYYLDRRTGILYLYPPADLEHATVEIGMWPEAMVTMEQVTDLRLEGLTFDLGRYHGIVLKDCRRCLVAGCTVSRMAGNGISIHGGAENGLLGCDVHTTGRRATEVIGGDRATLTPGRHFVENCRLHGFGRIDRTYTPAIQLEGVGHRVAHNLMYDGPSSVMRIEGNDHVIEYNEVFNAVTESDDQGGMELFANPTYRGVVFRHNRFTNCGKAGAGASVHGQAAIRLDDAISGMLVYGNVFVRSANGHVGAVQINSGRDNVIDNNLFIDCRQAVSGGSREYVRALLRVATLDLRLSTPVESIRRLPNEVRVRTARGDVERYDHVFLACHAPQALAMLDVDPQGFDLMDRKLAQFILTGSSARKLRRGRLGVRRCNRWQRGGLRGRGHVGSRTTFAFNIRAIMHIIRNIPDTCACASRFHSDVVGICLDAGVRENPRVLYNHA